MNSYHRLGELEKSALAAGALTLGKNLVTKGLWSNVGRGGANLAARGGHLGTLGRGIQTGAQGMQTATPYLGAYGLVGMASGMAGYNLPGSELAFNLSMPGVGAVMSAPNMIRTGRLAGGGYNDAIAQDAQQGARQAGQDWLSASHANPAAAYDPSAYQRFLQENGLDTSAAERYMGGSNPVQPQSAWNRLGNVFGDPTGVIMPAVQQQIYQRMGKQASVEKAAWAKALQAGAKGWTRSRAAGQWAPRAGYRAATSGWKASPVAAWGRANPAAYATAGLAPFVLPSVYDGYQAVTEEKPYDATRIQQEGYDAAQGGIRDRLRGLSATERQLAKFDPSLAAAGVEQTIPGTIAGWEQQTGQQHQQGALGSLYQMWNQRRTPGATGYYSYDANGGRNYL